MQPSTHGLGWPEVHISVVRCMSFSWRTHPEVRTVLWVPSLADSLLYSVSLQTGLHVHQRDASLICSLFRPCRQGLSSFGKGDSSFLPWRNLKERPHARTQRSTGWTCTFSDSHWFHCAFLKLDVNKHRRGFLLCARYFRQPRVCPYNVPVGLAQSIALEHATMRVNVHSMLQI